MERRRTLSVRISVDDEREADGGEFLSWMCFHIWSSSGVGSCGRLKLVSHWESEESAGAVLMVLRSSWESWMFRALAALMRCENCCGDCDIERKRKMGIRK